MISGPVQGVTPATDANNFAVGRQPVSAVEKPIVAMTRYEVKAILRKEKEKGSMSSICLDLKPLNATEVTTKLYSMGQQYQKFNGREGNTRELVVCFLDFMGAYMQIYP